MKFEIMRIYLLSEFSVCCHPKMLLLWQREVTTSPLYSHLSSPLPAKDVSPGGTSAPQRQKFHTDEVKSVRNLVKSSDWSTK